MVPEAAKLQFILKPFFERLIKIPSSKQNSFAHETLLVKKLIMINFDRCCKFLKVATFYGELIWCDFLILDYILFFQNQIFKDKKQNFIGI